MERAKPSWLLLISLLIVEYCIFRNYVLRDIAPFYPVAYDQTFYLSISYQLYENMITHGIIKGLAQFHLMSQSFFFCIQAAFFFLLFGASRLSALTINFIYFALLQIISFQVIKNLTSRYAFGFVFVGLLITTRFLFAKGGGAVDFRIDFIAFCLYGIFCACILNTHSFLNKKWCVISAIAAFFLIGMRFITICYVLPIFLFLLFYYGFYFFLQKKQLLDYSITKQKLKNIGWFLVILIALTAPLLWMHYQSLVDYYVGGHVKSIEKILRLKEAGIKTTIELWLYYPVNFFKRQLSYFLLGEILFCYLVLLILYLILYFKRRPKNLLPIHFKPQDNILFLILAILVPIIILTLDTSKSSIVSSIAVAPFLYLVVLGFSFVCEKIRIYSSNIANKTIQVFSIFFIASGLYLYIEHTTHRPQSDELSSLQNISKLISDVGNYAHFLNWKTISISRDQIKDYLVAPISTFYYESNGVLFNMKSPLGANGMIQETKENAIKSIKQSSMFISNLENYSPDNIFPFERSIQPYRTLLRQIAEKEMLRLGDYYVKNSMYRVYVKPDMKIVGLENNWITEHGIWLEFPALVAQKIHGVFILEGDSDFSWLKNKELKITAIAQEDGVDKILPAKIIINNNHYKIIGKLPAWKNNNVFSIHLTFSDYFTHVAKHHRIQKLVMQAPTKKYFEKETKF